MINFCCEQAIRQSGPADANLVTPPGGSGQPPVTFNYADNNANQRTQVKLANE
jgi:hypothetical protein